MCGIRGHLSRSGPPSVEAVAAMAATLHHRGPDADGSHLNGPVALGHRRLSIIALSETVREPMTNEDGSLWLVFNGESYSFRRFGRELKLRHHLRSQGDGEVILQFYGNGETRPSRPSMACLPSHSGTRAGDARS